MHRGSSTHSLRLKTDRNKKMKINLLHKVLRHGINRVRKSLTVVLFVCVLVALIGSGQSYAQGGAVGFVQGNVETPQTPQSSVTVTYTDAQLAGDLNLVVVGWNDAAAHVTSVTDTSGNTYVLAVGPTVRPGALTQAIYYAKNISGANTSANSVTVSFSAAAVYPDIRIAEYTGLDKVNPLDAASGDHGFGVVTNSGTLTTTNPSDLLIGANTVSGISKEPGANFINRMFTQDGDILQDRLVSAAGVYSAGTVEYGTEDWVMQTVAFRVAPGVTVAYIQDNFAVPTSPQSSVQVEFLADQLAGDLNAVIVGWNDATAHVQSVSDAVGNPYALAAG